MHRGIFSVTVLLFRPGYLFVFGAVILLLASCDTSASRKLTNENENKEKDWPAAFGFGRTATQRAIDSLDIDIMPDGKGLPPGNGNTQSGLVIYQSKCIACHGPTGAEGPFAKLVGAMGDTTKAKTIGNYWPYATTIFDYVRRTMPLTAPGSLTNDEVYSLTAYLLYTNKIIDSTMELNAGNLATIDMPAKKMFVPDDRQPGPAIR